MEKIHEVIATSDGVEIDLSAIKLIVWDLDETFWQGTLSEGGVVTPTENIELIRTLTDRGIMNSICSKNDFSTVEAEFGKKSYGGLFDLFVFPSIDWTPKGQRVKELVDNMQLRDVNVLFIDDNNSNLEEVRFYCSGIKVATPGIIAHIRTQAPASGKDDRDHSRLKQYKVLEKKHVLMKASASNEDFLRQSGIEVLVHRGCLKEEARLFELIERTNQLNYTKNRTDAAAFHVTLEDEGRDNGYITVRDAYGDYGIVGFWSKDCARNRLDHFVFSCRILGMGVTRCLYEWLGCPVIEVKGEVSEPHTGDGPSPDWIRLTEAQKDASDEAPVSAAASQKKVSILIKGPCDLSTVMSYISADCKLDTEFLRWNNEMPCAVTQFCTLNIARSHAFSTEEKTRVFAAAPFVGPDDMETAMFSGKYDYIFLSTLYESRAGVYREKRTGDLYIFGIAVFPFTDPALREKFLMPDWIYRFNVGFTPSLLDELSARFEFIGFMPVEKTIENLEYILDHIPRSSTLVLLLGSEIESQKRTVEFDDGTCDRHVALNRAIEIFARGRDNLRLINMTELIEGEVDYTDCIDHFSRRVYFRLSGKMREIVNVGGVALKVNSRDIVHNLMLSFLKICLYSALSRIPRQGEYFREKRKKYTERFSDYAPFVKIRRK